MTERTALPRIAVSLPFSLILASLAPIVAAQMPALPVQISADRAEMDDRRGVGTYTGDVVVTRGDMTLWADRIVIHAPDRRPLKIEAEGNPVRAEALDPDNQPRVATALRMEYSIADDTLLLLREARVQTATEDARGDRISYDLAQDIIRIEGTPTERVQIIIQPRPE
jgi:lipopolysaccharide export system protein LptA